MARSTRTKQLKSIQADPSPERTAGSPLKSSAPVLTNEAAPEDFAAQAEPIGHILQRMSKEGRPLPMDCGGRAQNLLAIQKTLGNRTVQRLVQRQHVPAPAAGVTPPAVAGPIPAVNPQQELRDFRARGPLPAAAAGTTIVPTTGMGGFNARYNPRTMTLEIKLNVGMRFLDGMTISGSTVRATQNSMDQSAISMNNRLSTLRGARLTRALARIRNQWTWSGPNDRRITGWMADYRRNVTSAWSSAGTGIIFQGSRPGWQTQLARVRVVVNTRNVTAAAPGAAIPGPQPIHCTADIYKTPNEDVFGAGVAPGTAASGTDQHLELGSGQITARSHLLTQSVPFGDNSSTLDPAGEGLLRQWIISFQATPGTAGRSISITGRASATGNTTAAGRRKNRQLSLARAREVERFLKNATVEGSLLRNAATRINSVTGAGAAGAGEEEEWRRVDIVVAGGQGQNIAAHEFGHMIGLGDEYASTPLTVGGVVQRDAEGNPISRGVISGTGGEVGAASQHSVLANKMGLGSSAVFENNENLMSLGNTIRPQHYATFMSALHTVSGLTEWRVKP